MIRTMIAGAKITTSSASISSATNPASWQAAAENRRLLPPSYRHASMTKAERSAPRRRILAAVLFGLCSFVVAAGANAAEKSRLILGLTHDAGAGPLLIAAANHYFSEEGVEVELRFLASDALVTKGLASGTLDLGLAELDAPFFAAAGKDQLKLLASAFSDQAGYPANGLLISKKARAAGFRSVHDLPGKRIGMTAPGAGVRYSLERVALRYHLDSGTIQRVYLRTAANELDALARGTIDGAILPYATALTQLRAGKGGAVIRLSDLNQWQEGAIAAPARTIAAKRPAIEAFIRAYRRGVAEYDLTFQQRSDEGEVLPGPRYAEYLALIGREAKLPPALLQQTMRYCDHLARLDAADIERQLAFWQEQGLVDRRIIVADLFDLSFNGEPIR
jgi:NitT/TauT family transport system substrate-binding protein